MGYCPEGPAPDPTWGTLQVLSPALIPRLCWKVATSEGKAGCAGRARCSRCSCARRRWEGCLSECGFCPSTGLLSAAEGLGVLVQSPMSRAGSSPSLRRDRTAAFRCENRPNGSRLLSWPPGGWCPSPPLAAHSWETVDRRPAQGFVWLVVSAAPLTLRG